MRTKFVQDGIQYEHADTKPDLVPGSVRRFTYGAEPQIIARVPLKGGGIIEIHGYGGHYNSDWATVDWNDNVHHFTCWVPAADVRRAAEGEWHGNYVAS